jgi:hypothetical protein
MSIDDGSGSLTCFTKSPIVLIIRQCLPQPALQPSANGRSCPRTESFKPTSHLDRGDYIMFEYHVRNSAVSTHAPEAHFEMD